jgi:hypothetical protein
MNPGIAELVGEELTAADKIVSLVSELLRHHGVDPG